MYTQPNNVNWVRLDSSNFSSGDEQPIFIPAACKVVVDALDLAYKGWRIEAIKKTTQQESLLIVDRTHQMVTDYIKAMLCPGTKKSIPLIGI